MGDLEPQLTREQFELFRALLQRTAGIALNGDKLELASARLIKRLRALKLRSYERYYRLLKEEGSNGEELVHFTNALTTNKTSFFRESHHFDVLRSHVLEPLAQAARRGGPKRLRIWSAGSSSGEEAYTLLMTVAETIPDFATWDIRVLASDIDTEMLEATDRAEYGSEQVEEQIPPRMTERWLRRGSTGSFEVRHELRSKVTTRRLNLARPPWPIRARFDAIFCRNALIYLAAPEQRRAVAEFISLLGPDGLLCLGHSESILGVQKDLRLLGKTAFARRPDVASREVA